MKAVRGWDMPREEHIMHRHGGAKRECQERQSMRPFGLADNCDEASEACVEKSHFHMAVRVSLTGPVRRLTCQKRELGGSRCTSNACVLNISVPGVKPVSSTLFYLFASSVHLRHCLSVELLVIACRRRVFASGLREHEHSPIRETWPTVNMD